MVVLVAEIPEANVDSLSNSHFQSEIITRIKLHSDKDLWMVPLSSLLGP